MNFIKYFSLLFFIIIANPLLAQIIIPYAAVNLVQSVDNYIYIQQPNGEIVKTDSLGIKLFSYSNTKLGAPQLGAISNTFSVAVFYPRFQTIVFLDNKMAEIGSIDVTQAGHYFTHICPSADGSLWLISQNKELTKYFANRPLNGNFIQIPKTILPRKYTTTGMVEVLDGTLNIFSKEKILVSYGNFEGQFKATSYENTLKNYTLGQQFGMFFYENDSIVLNNNKNFQTLINAKSFPAEYKSSKIVLYSDRCYFLGKNSVFLQKF